MKKSLIFLVLGALIIASVTSCKKDPQLQALKQKKISAISYSEFMTSRDFNWFLSFQLKLARGILVGMDSE